MYTDFQTIIDLIETEKARAIASEERIGMDLASERKRALASEDKLMRLLDSEIARAKNSEG